MAKTELLYRLSLNIHKLIEIFAYRETDQNSSNSNRKSFFFFNETRDKSKEDSAKTSLKDEKEKREKYKSEKVFSSLDSLPGQKYIT